MTEKRPTNQLTGRGGSICLALVLTGFAYAQERTMPASPSAFDPHDISGFWELYFDGQRVPRAQLTDAVTKAVLDAQAAKDAKAVRWCNILGMPFLMGVNRPLDIRQGKREIVIAPESAVATPRHLYLDRSAHINADVWDPNTVGDSIAHWEGDTLVVDTIGFEPEHGMTAIPGGGFRTADSRLVERFRLLKNGSLLSVMFTWIDPKVFRTPHTYEFRYTRAPRDYEARLPVTCDPFDEERTRFLTGSPQSGNSARLR